MTCGGRKVHLLLPFMCKRLQGQLCKSWVRKDSWQNYAIARWNFQTEAPIWFMAKLGGAGGRFSEGLHVDGKNLP